MDEPAMGGGMSTGTKVTGVLMVVAVVAVAVAAFNFFTILAFKPTGHATDQGNATLEIESQIVINFTVDLIDWGIGYVNSSASYAELNTEGLMTGTGWQTVTQGLVLESTSNENVTVNLSSDVNADEFIDGGFGTGLSTFEWKVSDNEANSCSTGAQPSGYADVTTTDTVICSNLLFGAEGTPEPNTLLIDLQLNITKSTATVGTKKAVLTATAEKA